MKRDEAEALLKRAIGDPDARFREGQWEAIDGLVNRRHKLLVVQRTGWGKSSVYFISTKILRDRGAGQTIIISPLLALMRNQIEAANRLEIRAATINSANQDQWREVQEQILGNKVDAVLVSPERLSNEGFVENILLPIAGRIGLLVVDEVHCISDWGHDFRPDYRRILNVLRQMPANMPVLGTTATANDRVVHDIRDQLGELEIHRGSLVRDSLELQTLRLPDQGARLAWLAEHVPDLPGTGIVYTLTIRDAEQVAAWLQQNGLSARAYHGSVTHPDFPDSNCYRLHLEELLLSNEIKVLVATTALGMGYDKPDLGFVVHYQAPGSIVAYYQQVGRAGRAIARACGVLLAGREDDDIHEYFRRNAFPNEVNVLDILEVLDDHDALSSVRLEEHLNLTRGQIEKVLKYLSVENPAPVIKDGSQWRRTPVQFAMDHETIARLTGQREQEWAEVQEYIDTDECLRMFLRSALDDPAADRCGKCANCLGRPIVATEVSRAVGTQAARFLRHADIPIKPKVQVASGAFQEYRFRGNLAARLRAEEGRILSRWGDAGWGCVVAEDKHDNYFRQELVEAAAELVQENWIPNPPPEWVTCVPSRRHRELVPDYAGRLAERLGLPFIEAIVKVRDNEPQKLQQNRYHQCRNLDGAFSVMDGIPAGPVLLVDDIVDSGWTMTIAAALLRNAGSGPVFPFALANSRPGS